MSIIIKEAVHDDIEAWRNLRSELWPGCVDVHIRETDEYFSHISKNIQQVFLLSDNSRFVGFIELNVRYFAEGSHQPRVPFVEGWYVQPAYRNRGYGKKLFETAEKWAVSLGFNEIASDTEIENNQSITIHKKMGFKETERIVCFLKKLV